MTMPAEPGDAGQPVNRRWLFIAIGVIVVAIAAYWWFNRRNNSGVINTSGGGGSASSGTTTIDKGAVQITVTQGSGKQPRPPVRRKTSKVAVPDVIGQRYPQAAREVERAKLTPDRVRPYSGATTNESPDAGTDVKRGSVVKLTGSDRPES